jgi:hypothetical protein
VTPWPTNAVGSPLLHVITLDLAAVDAALDAPCKEAWGRALREGLPRQGTLSVFHDGVADGAGAADQRSWAIRYSQSESRELLSAPASQPPEVVCALAHSGFTVPAPADPPYSCASDTAWRQLDKAWCLTPSGGQDRRMTYLYGHSRFGQESLQPVLDSVLPASEANPHRLIASLTPPFAEWLGEETTLEVWMREEDLNARHFEAAWCTLRQEGTRQDPS